MKLDLVIYDYILDEEGLSFKDIVEKHTNGADLVYLFFSENKENAKSFSFYPKDEGIAINDERYEQTLSKDEFFKIAKQEHPSIGKRRFKLKNRDLEFKMKGFSKDIKKIKGILKETQCEDEHFLFDFSKGNSFFIYKTGDRLKIWVDIDNKDHSEFFNEEYSLSEVGVMINDLLEVVSRIKTIKEG